MVISAVAGIWAAGWEPVRGFPLARWCVAELGAGLSYCRISFSHDNWFIDDDRVEISDWVFGGQLLGSLTFKAGQMMLGLKLKYQLTADADEGAELISPDEGRDCSNFKIGLQFLSANSGLDCAYRREGSGFMASPHYGTGRVTGTACRNVTRAVSTILVFCGCSVLCVLAGCGDDDFGGPPENFSSGLHHSETEIGPEGGVIEVTEPESPLHGFKVVIPVGTFASTATVTIDEGYGEPNLPSGLEYMGPEIEITADVPFLKEMQIYFPVPESTGKDGKMICAFFWDSIDASWWEYIVPPWRLEFPESADGGLLCVSAGYSGTWSWGEVLLDEVDVELLEPAADEWFGPDFLDRMATAFNSDILRSLGLIDWENFSYCENRITIGTIIAEIRDSAEIHSVEDLVAVNVLCEIWDHEPGIGDVFYGIEEVIQIHVDLLAGTIGAEAISLVPFIGDIASILVKGAVQATYEQRLSDLANEYACLFVQADAMLWIEIGIYFMAEASLLGMEMVQNAHPCP